jgi:homoserine kinase
VVRAPATSANLGPGFDAFGLALGLHDQLEARVTGGGLAVEVHGEGEETAGAGERHLVVTAMRAAFCAMGGQPPGIALRCTNRIPHGRGLGSSAAAVVSGILAARALLADGADRLPGAGVLRLAVDLEGHPDNVAACLAGGLTVAWRPGVTGGAVSLLRLDVLDSITAVACVAPTAMATRGAGRSASVGPARDAAANAARSARWWPRSPATRQRLRRHRGLLHQRYRAAAMPPTDLLAGCAGPVWRRSCPGQARAFWPSAWRTPGPALRSWIQSRGKRVSLGV